jgi:hypothetical protein
MFSLRDISFKFAFFDLVASQILSNLDVHKILRRKAIDHAQSINPPWLNVIEPGQTWLTMMSDGLVWLSTIQCGIWP